VRAFVPREQHDPRGVAIDPVDHPEVFLPLRFEAPPQGVRRALVAARNHGHARRLGDRNDVGVFVQHLERRGFHGASAGEPDAFLPHRGEDGKAERIG